MKPLFFVLLTLGIYPYVLYPVIAAALARVFRRSVAAVPDYTPTVTVLTAAHNEERQIGATVYNKLEQDYPPALLRVLVVSDASTDRTDEIVRALAEQDGRVTLLRNPQRQGKTAALNLAMRQIDSEVVIFADANSMYRSDAIRRLMAPLADPDVGYVTGRMLYVDSDGTLVGDGCSAYMKYENALRSVETRLGSIVGVDGGVDAIRRRLYRAMEPDQLPDFVLPLRVVEQGYRVVYEPGAVLTEETLEKNADEYRMRVRVALRAFWALHDMRHLLGGRLNAIYAWQLWSHKLLRYLSFLPLSGALVLNWLLLGEGTLFRLLLAGQVAVIGLALAAAVSLPTLGRSLPARLCWYFVLLNWASAVAFVRFLRGQKQVLWQPRTG